MQGTGILDPAYDMNQFYVVLLSLDLYKGRCWTTGVAIILLSTKNALEPSHVLEQCCSLPV